MYNVSVLFGGLPHQFNDMAGIGLDLRTDRKLTRRDI
jgi:hypothetical protein